MIAKQTEPELPSITYSLLERRRTIAICIGLAAAVWIVFGGTWQHQFVDFDDDFCVYHNRQVIKGLNFTNLVWAFTHTQLGHWDPLTTISHMVDCQLFGLWAGGHHLINVLLHSGVAIFLFLALLRMTASTWPSALAAALFAIHPLRAESVAWVTERKDVLSGLFFAITIMAYARSVRPAFSWRRSIAVAALFALGLMCKSMIVTLPVVLLLLDYWPLGRFSPPRNGDDARAGTRAHLRAAGRLLVEKIPLLALSAASCVATWLAVQKDVVSINQLSMSARIGNALVSYVVYIGSWIFPRGLAVLYPHPLEALPRGQVAGAAILLVGISPVVFLLRRQCPYLLVGWLWYLVMLLPVIGIIQAGNQSHADRYTYLPQIGLAVALAWLLKDIAMSRGSPEVIGVLGGSMIVVLMVCTWRQVSYWRDSESLWARALACTSRNSVAYTHYGLALARVGRVDEAMLQFQLALKTDGNNAFAWYNLGLSHYGRGEGRAAIFAYEQSIKADHDMNLALNNLAWLFATFPDASLRNGTRSVELAERANVLTHDEDASHLGTLAAAYAECGRFDDAIRTIKRARQLAMETDQTSALKGLQTQLNFYESGRPYYEWPGTAP